MKVLATDGISEAGVDILTIAGFEVIDKAVPQEDLAKFINDNDITALVVRSATQVRKDLIESCPNLKVIGRAGVGMDNIDVKFARESGRIVVNTPNASSVSVAELVIGHMLNIARSLTDSNRQMPLEGDSRFAALKKKYSQGKELRGKTLGVIGFGRIGQEAAKLAVGMGMKVIFSDVFVKEAREIELNFFDGQSVKFSLVPSSLDDVLAQSDFITLHVPSQKSPIIDAKAIAKMKDGVVLINAARGGVVDEEALVAALESGKISGAGLDVFQSEPNPSIALLMNPSISLSPHIGASTTDAQDKIGIELANNIVEAFTK